MDKNYKKLLLFNETNILEQRDYIYLTTQSTILVLAVKTNLNQLAKPARQRHFKNPRF